MIIGRAFVGVNAGANTATVLVLPAPIGGLRWAITTISAGYNATPTASDPQLTVAGVGITNPVPLEAAGPAPMPWFGSYPPGAVTITVPAGGSGVTGYLNVMATEVY
jgi:hypothetical protein